MKDKSLITSKRAEIESELRRLGWWQSDPLPAGALQNMGAFGMNTLAFSQWLQFVLLPRVDEILAEGGGWPESSHVGAHAVREFDGVADASSLVNLLCEWDGIFNA